MRSGLFLASVTVLVGGLVACSAEPDSPLTQRVVVPVEGGGSYVDILPVELNQMLDSKDFLFINVHIPNEGEIPGTDLHFPYDQISTLRSQLPEELESKIVLYCRSGSMSAIAARELVGLGYSQIYNLDGGFRAWIQAGYDFNP